MVIYYIVQCNFTLLSSPYLLVFGNDRVMCYTRADDVAGGTCAWGKTFMMFFCFMDFKSFVIIYVTKLGVCNRQSQFVDFDLLQYNKCCKFS